MKNKPWKFKAAGRGKLTIELFDQIGEDPWSGEGTSAAAFREELEGACPGISDITSDQFRWRGSVHRTFDL